MTTLDRLLHARHMAQLLDSFAGLHLLRVGIELGLFEALRRPQPGSELAERLGLAPDLVEAWLRAAALQGFVVRDGESYRRSAFVGWLCDAPEAGALQALLEEAVRGWSPRFQTLPELLKGAERPQFGSREEALRIASAMRILEPRALRALDRIDGVRRARRILDVGCGYGTYLSSLLQRYRDALGVGVELDADVAEEARRSLREAQVARRGEILTGDFMELDVPPGQFDLAMLNNNLHYFAPAERAALLRRIASRLTERGLLAVQTPVVSGQAAARVLGASRTVAHLDLYLRLHRNLHALPEPVALREALAEAGFAETGEVPVLPGRVVVYVWGRRRAS